MKKTIFIYFLIPIVCFANIISFNSQNNILAQNINSNFSFIKNILNNKNIAINFKNFQSGELILKETFEAEFDKLRVLGITINELSSDVIRSSELNTAFNQASEGALIYDDVPVANNIDLNISEDILYSGSFSFINLVGNSTAEIISNPNQGTISVSNGLFVYTPNLNYSGSDSFSYRIFDGANYSNIATVSVNISPINDVPTSQSNSYILNEDTSQNILLSSSDADGDLLSYSIVNPPQNGTISGTLPNITYTPNLNYNGADSFSFKTTDGKTESNIATISLTINPVNDAPVIADLLEFSTAQNGSGFTHNISVSDPDDAYFLYTISQNPSKGSVTVSNLGLVSYTPSLNTFGADSFTVVVNDGKTNSNLMNVSVMINGEGIIINNGARNYFDGSLASSCNEYKVNSNGNYKYAGSVGNGLYRISVQSGGSQIVYCDMTTDSGGWTLVASGGTSCGSFNQKTSTNPVYNSHADYSSNCGYLSEPVVKSIALVSSNVRLRAGSSATSYSQVSSTASGPITSLRNSTNWHNNSAYTQFSSGWVWNWSCGSAATSWPNMFHACNYTNGVHWLASNKHSNNYSAAPSVSSTWLK